MTEMATHLNPVTGYAPYQSALVGWTYDSFGNYVNEALSGSTSFSMPQPSPYTYTSANQIVGFTYDSAGNQTSDPVLGPNTHVYDAENRVYSSGNGSTTYLYDAEGQRVAKYSGGTLTNQYLLGLGGEQVTELDGNGNWLHSNAYAAGKMLATYDNVGLHFQFSDWLGSRRVQADGLGNIEETCLNLPFGDMLNCSGPGSDATEQHFTGKFHDNESGLDYFGARYYASNMGRWTSPDPSGLALADLGNPQSLNLYSYVINNPAILVDPDGLCYNQQQSSVWSCIGAFFHNLFGGGSDSSSSPSSSGSSSSTSSSQESITVTMHWSTQLMQPGINYGNPNGPKGNNVGGCPLGTCHNFDGMYRPLTRGTFDGGMFMMGILDGGFGVSPSMFGKPAGGSTYEEGVAAAQARYPSKAGRIEMHHIAPKYLGGDPLGPTVPLDGAYHQMITNEFRNAVPYGTGPIPPEELHQLMKKVYETFPLPPGS